MTAVPPAPVRVGTALPAVTQEPPAPAPADSSGNSGGNAAAVGAANPPPAASPANPQTVAVSSTAIRRTQTSISLAEARRVGGEGQEVSTRTKGGLVTTFATVDGEWCMHCLRTAIGIANNRDEGLSGVVPVCLMGDTVARCYQCVNRNKTCEGVGVFLISLPDRR